MGDKLGGLTEEMKGKVLKKPEVAQHGHDRRTGELKKQEEDAAVCIDLILSLFASVYLRLRNAHLLPTHYRTRTPSNLDQIKQLRQLLVERKSAPP